MGEFPLQDNTHVKRSSGMAFAWRQKQDNLRVIGPLALFAAALAVMFVILMQGTATKQVTIVLNGQEMTVTTNEWVVGELLEEQGITVQEHDRLSVALDAKLKNGDILYIDYTKPITITADGITNTLYTTGATVAGALQDLNIPVGEDDIVSPSLDTELTGNDQVKIVRVTKEIAEQTVPIAFETITRQDPNLTKGKEQVIQEGQEGVKLVTVEKVYHDGELVAENVIGETIQTESVNRIVALGTKAPVTTLSASSPDINQVTKDGITFSYKKVLNNVTLTAYSAGPDSTGKDEDHPQYGITYTGTTVTEGRTIAVDKNVIPLGWWVYIEGFGFRRAEDIGGAVKGNKIDIYFDKAEYAAKFGTKRGYTVYVIGPKKPTAD